MRKRRKILSLMLAFVAAINITMPITAEAYKSVEYDNIGKYDAQNIVYKDIESDKVVSASVASEDEDIRYRFTADESCRYVIDFTELSDNAYVLVYDSDMNLVFRTNFECSENFYIENGKKYYIRLASNSGTVSGKIHLSKFSPKNISETLQDLTVNGGVSTYYRFVPDHTAYYSADWYGNTEDDKVIIKVFEENLNWNVLEDSYGNGCELLAGETYYIEVIPVSAKNSTEGQIRLKEIKYNNLKTGVTQSYAITHTDSYFDYEFKPEKTGLYRAELSETNGIPYVIVIDNNNKIKYSNNSVYSFNSDNTYHIRISDELYGSDKITGKFTLVDINSEVNQLYEGVKFTTKTDGTAGIFKFIPKESGLYNVTGTYDGDKKVYLNDFFYDETMTNQIPFYGTQYIYNLEAGKTYYLKESVSISDSVDEIEYSVVVNKLNCKDLTLATEENITLKNNDNDKGKWYTYTPSETSFFTITTKSDQALFNVYNSSFTKLNTLNDSELTYMFEAGKAYYIDAEKKGGWAFYDADSIGYSFALNKTATDSIEEGKEMTVEKYSSGSDEYKYFVFTSNNKCEYTISNNTKYATDITIYDDTLKSIATKQLSADSDKYTITLAKDKKYIFAVKKNASGNASLKIQGDLEKIKSEAKIICDNSTDASVVTLGAATLTQKYGNKYCQALKIEAKKDGFYHVKIQDSQNSMDSLNVVNEAGDTLSGNFIIKGEQSGSSKTSESYAMYLKAGTYYVFMKYTDAKVPQRVITSYVQPEKEITGDINETITVENNAYPVYKFTPSQSGEYCFMSTASSYIYMYGLVYDENFKKIASDSSGYLNGQFKLTYNFEAGKTYYVVARKYSLSEKDYQFTFRFNKLVDFSQQKNAAQKISLTDGSDSSDMKFDAATVYNDSYSKILSFNADTASGYTFEITAHNFYGQEACDIDILDEYGNKLDNVSESVTTAYLYDEDSGRNIDVRKYQLETYLSKGQYYIGIKNSEKFSSITYSASVAMAKYVTDIDVNLKNGLKGLYYRSGGSDVRDDVSGKSWYRFENIADTLYDITLKYSDGTTEMYSKDNPVVSITDNQSYNNQWLPGSTNNILTIKAGSVKKNVIVTVLPQFTVSSIKLSLEKDAALIANLSSGSTVSEDMYNEETSKTEKKEYYKFNRDSYIGLIYAEVVLQDGSVVKGSLKEFDDGLLGSVKVNITDNQSVYNIWQKDSANNTVTLEIEDIKQTINVPIITYKDLYKGAAVLKADGKVRISYASAADNDLYAPSAAFFTPDESGDYYFYSEGNVDTKAVLYVEENNLMQKIDENDDGYSNNNFVIKAALEKGKTYLIQTKPVLYSASYDSDGNVIPVDYNICVTKNNFHMESYSDFADKDLSGKCIDLTLVVDAQSDESADRAYELIDNIVDFINAISNTKADIRVSLITYKNIDENGKSSTVLHYSPAYSNWYESSEADDLCQEIKYNCKYESKGNKTTIIDALGYASDISAMKFNSDASKYMLVISDSDYINSNSYGIADMNAAISRLKEQNISASVITTKQLYNRYNRLAYETGGTLLNSTKSIDSILKEFANDIVDDAQSFNPDKSVVPVESVTIGDDITVLEGKIKCVKPQISPENATLKDVEWRVEDESIAEISQSLTDGGQLVIQAKKCGSTNVIAQTKDGGYAASFNLDVQAYINTSKIVETCDISQITEALKTNNLSISGFVFYSDKSEDLSIQVPEESQKFIFTKLKSQKKNITFVKDNEYGDCAYKWQFNGSDITNADLTVDFGIDIDNKDSEVYKFVHKMSWEKKLVIDFVSKAQLPGKALVSVPADGFSDGTYDLYRYDGNGKFTIVDSVVVQNKTAQLNIDTTASYVVASRSDKEIVVTDIILDKTQITLTQTGESVTVTADVIPYDAVDRAVTWSSDNESVATVKDGVVTAVSEGKAVITAKSGDCIAACTVEVKFKQPDPDDNPDNRLAGDANGDGKVDLKDALAVLKAALGIIDIEDKYFDNADANNDGKVDLQDASLVLRAALGIINL